MFNQGIIWCSLCNSAPSQGILKALDNGHEIELNACQSCVDKIKPEDWIK